MLLGNELDTALYQKNIVLASDCMHNEANARAHHGYVIPYLDNHRCGDAALR